MTDGARREVDCRAGATTPRAEAPRLSSTPKEANLFGVSRPLPARHYPTARRDRARARRALVRKLLMSTRAHSLRKKLRLALIAAACGVAPLATPHAQGRTTQDASASLAQNTSASTAQVAQALARVRSPSA